MTCHGQWVAVTQVGQLVATQNSADGAGRHAEFVGDELLASSRRLAQRHDGSFHFGGGAAGQRCGLEERSTSPAGPSSRKRRTHR